jgi:hypothetical protein
MKDFNVSGEMALYRQAANKRWPVTDKVRAKVAKRVEGVLDTSIDDKSILEAANTLIAMDKLNLAEERIYAPKVKISPKELPTAEVLNKLKALMVSNPALRERILNDCPGSQAALPD